MKKKHLLLTTLLTFLLTGTLGAESNKWVEEFLRRYQPSTTESSQGQSATPLGQAIQTGNVAIGMNDLVNLMLDYNLDIQSNRFSPRSSYYSALVFYRFLQPSVSFSGTIGRNTTPSTSQLAGGRFTTALTDSFAVNYAQNLSYGTTLGVSVTENRLSSSSNNVVYNPSWTGKVTYTALQHLWQNRGRSINLHQILQGENNTKISEVNFEIQLISAINTAQKAYWDLVYAAENLKISQQSLDVALTTLNENEMKVEIGTLAPIDVVQTKADVATRRDTLVSSSFGVTSAEDQIKKLISADKNPSLFLLKFTPKDAPVQPSSVQIPSLEDAVKIALENRPEMRAAQLDLKNKEIDVQYTENQKKPALDLIASFTQNSVGGTQIRGFLIGQTGLLANPIPGGIGDSLRQLFDYNYKGYALGFNFSIPLNNKAAIADHDRAVTEKDLSDAKLAATAQSILLDVRNALQQVELNRARIETAQVALDLEQQKLDAEKTKFDLGTSTLRFVLEEQRNLAQAQTTELQTRISFAKAVLDLDKAMGLTLQRNNIELERALNKTSMSEYKPASTPAATAPAAQK